MGSKKKLKKKSENVNNEKISKKEKQINPFEIHVNKKKFTIIGRKCKHDKGLPGVSRAKAIKKRKNTLGIEYKNINKRNKFKDNRITNNYGNDGVNNARFTAEKTMQYKTKKQNLFNLNDDEILTHHGQTLEEIEKFDDPLSDDSGEENLDADFTSALNFGSEQFEKNRKDAIAEMIAESKIRKAELAREKNEMNNLREKLDENFKSLIPIIGNLGKQEANDIKPKPNDYDRLVKELIFAPRGEVTDRLPSEEFLAKKQKLELEKLEKERQERMHGEESIQSKSKHRSADDLDYGYFENVDEPTEPEIAYSLDEKECIPNIIKVPQMESEQDDDEETTIEDNFSDLNTDSLDSDDESLNDNHENVDNIEKKPIKISNEKNLINTDIENLPYIYEIPSTYDHFLGILKNNSLTCQMIILDRMLKYNHPKVENGNKEKIVLLFNYLLQYFMEIFSKRIETNIEEYFKIFYESLPYLYDLVQMNPKITSNFLLNIIKEKYSRFMKKPKNYPNLDTTILFIFVSNIYSVSDFRHPVVTPCFIFIDNILTKARVKNFADVAMGLVIVNTVIKCTSYTKRYISATFNFLQGILYLCMKKRSIDILKPPPPFSSNINFKNLLVLNKKIEFEKIKEFIKLKDLVTDKFEEDFKIRALNTTILYIKRIIEIIQDNVGACYFIEPFINFLERLDLEFYPNFVKDNYTSTIQYLNLILNKPLVRLTKEKEKPKALKLYDPYIEKVYDDKRRPKLTKNKEERVKLLHRVKRETKGALREIRKDNAFITKMRITKQIQSDMERKAKVQRIYAEAAIQQGELKALERKNKQNS